MLRRFSGIAVALIALASIPLNGCSPTPAAAEVRDAVLTVTAVGDSAKAIAGVTVLSGTADSLRYVFTLRGAPPVTKSILAPITGVRQVVTAFLIPNPVYAEGDTGMVTACPIAYRKGNAYPGTCARPQPYTRPVIPPTSAGDTIITSLRLTPDTMTVALGDVVNFIMTATYQSGRQALAIRNYAVNGEAGWQYPSVTLGGITVASKLRVLAGANEPAGYQPFAISDLSEMPTFPRAPLKVMPCRGTLQDPAWCGRWL